MHKSNSSRFSGTSRTEISVQELKEAVFSPRVNYKSV